MYTKRLTFTVDLPLKKVWNLLRNFEDYLPLLPGYVNHKMTAEDEFLLIVKRQNSLINKSWNLRIAVKEWNEPVSFKLLFKESNKIFYGGALIQTKKLGADKTLFNISIRYEINGSLNKFVAQIFKTKDDKILIQEIISFLKDLPER